VRLRGEAFAGAVAVEQAGDGTAVNLEGGGHLVQRPFAALVSHDDLLA
jgi:hypothetical protein